MCRCTDKQIHRCAATQPQTGMYGHFGSTAQTLWQYCYQSDLVGKHQATETGAAMHENVTASIKLFLK